MELALMFLIVLLAQLYLALSFGLPLLDCTVASVFPLLLFTGQRHHAVMDFPLKIFLIQGSLMDYHFFLISQIIVKIHASTRSRLNSD